jgi:DNA-binding transcriptional ArsR family regulator
VTTGPRAGLSPLRRQLLGCLGEPASASDLARRLDLPRQKVNYHLRELERLGVIEFVDERRRRGFVERRLRAVQADRLSSAYLLSTALALAGDVGALRDRAAAADRRLATFTFEVDVAFATPAALREFAERLPEALGQLAAEYHQPAVPRARCYRFVVGGHPSTTKSEPEDQRDDG